MDPYIKSQIKVIATILVALLIAFWGYNFLKGYNLFNSSHVYRFRVSEVPPSIKAALVLYKGIQVGRITDVMILNNDSLEVFMEINSSFEVTDGFTVDMVFSGFFGEVNIHLLKKDGGVPFPKKGRGVPLANNSLLNSSVSSSAGLDMVTKYVEQALKPLPNFIKRLDDIAKLIHSQTQQVDVNRFNRILQNTDSLIYYMKTIVSTQSAENGIIDNLNSVVIRLKEIPTESRLKGIDSVIYNVQRLLEASTSVFQQVDTMSNHLNKTLKRISNEQGYLRSVLLDKRSNDRLDSLVVQLNQFLERLNKQPGRYLKEINIVKVF